MGKKLSDAGVAKLKYSPNPYPDPELGGHYVRVAVSGKKSFYTLCRNPQGRQVWTRTGPTDMLGGIEAAREIARSVLARVRAGKPAFEPTAETFGEVVENFLAAKAHLKTIAEYKRLLDAHVLPVWGNREFIKVGRADIALLLDNVEKRTGGRHQADAVLAVISSLMRWQAIRLDDYVVPLVRGMKRQAPEERKRERVLTADEIRAVWSACEGLGAFGAFVRLCLLTGQRRSKVAAMKWADIQDGVWDVPEDSPRDKGTGGCLGLPMLALAIIEAQPKIAGNPHVFAAARGGGAINGMSKQKARLDKLSKTSDWVLHDLRRTAKTLMGQAGINPFYSERLLGHVLKGVEAVYDKHSYECEKADALKRLAELVGRIVDPGSNVVSLRRAEVMEA